MSRHRGSFAWPRLLILPVLPVVLAVLAGCQMSEDDELQAWMEKVSSEAVPTPAPEPQPRIIQPIVYDPADHADPFSIGKITALASVLSGNGATPDLQRVREPLESYPLDSLRMVGSLLRRGQAVALIQANKLLYQVRKGHHLGQDQGKVINISDVAVDIEEIVQESSGGWTTRRVQLSMQGGK